MEIFIENGKLAQDLVLGDTNAATLSFLVHYKQHTRHNVKESPQTQEEGHKYRTVMKEGHFLCDCRRITALPLSQTSLNRVTG
jgi:hypothetical protein